MDIIELNHWWTEKKVKDSFIPETPRDLFHIIEKDLGRKQIQALIGLRRTGKSTIFYQLINKLISKKINPLNIFYCSFDEPDLQEKRIEEILKDYSKITNIDYKKEKIYLFIDEAQKSKNWVESIKLIYDNFKNIKILVSGSASLDILTNSKKTLAGRIIYYELRPLKFREFLEIKGIKIEKKEVSLHADLLEKEFDKFLFRPFPEIVNEKDISFIKNYIRNAIIDPIILKDIPKEFKEADILLIETLTKIFLENPGQYLNLDELAKELKRTKTTLYKALFYLEFSFLIKRILNFRPSIRIASRKLSRVYAYHPALSLPFNIPEEKYAENLVFFELNTNYYWRDKEKEIDFLKNNMPVEVKYTSKINKNDLRWINYFLKKYGKKLKIKKSFIITKNVGGKIGDNSFIPLWKFCFCGLE
ncbi:ATP-binding protein [Candidatus Pacearchaeota archaeon]|nr:ATP-binding protein [Candidatus Pacearchaeota archaeon]